LAVRLCCFYDMADICINKKVVLTYIIDYIIQCDLFTSFFNMSKNTLKIPVYFVYAANSWALKVFFLSNV